MTALPASPALGGGDLDELLEACCEADQPFDWWRDHRDQWWSQLATACIDEVLAISPLFRSLASRSRPATGFIPGPAGRYRNLLLPSAIFKRDLPISDSPDVIGCSSSGTRGSLSSVPRDDVTLQRFFSGVRAMVRGVLDMGTSGYTLISLVPSISRPQAPWTSYVVAGMAASHQMIEAGSASPMDLLAAVIERNNQAVLVGAPAALLSFAEAVSRPGRWRDRLLVMSVGGWKTDERRSIVPAELRDRLSKQLGVAPVDIRDTYSMVEINSVLVECGQHRKHVPPWLEVVALAPRRFEPTPAGSEGMLAFFDPTATSYPAFVLSEDIGVLHNDSCRCGLPGPTLTGVRRMTVVEARGCALAAGSTKWGSTKWNEPPVEAAS